VGVFLSTARNTTMAIPPRHKEGNVSTPVRRIRWATQRVSAQSGRNKRHSIMERFHKGAPLNEKKRDSGGGSFWHRPHTADQHQGDRASEDGSIESAEAVQRRIFFNIELPDDAKDEGGHPIANFGRNKIRTAKYTPLSFVPKNLWFQFHNIANIYFLFLIILAVSLSGVLFRAQAVLTNLIGLDLPHIWCFKPWPQCRSADLHPFRYGSKGRNRGLAKNNPGQRTKQLPSP